MVKRRLLSTGMQGGDYITGELDRLGRGFEAGSFASLVEAVALCEANGVLPPPWLWRAIRDLAKATLDGRAPTGRRGAANAYAARLAKDRAHMARWDAASWCLARLGEAKARGERRLMGRYPPTALRRWHRWRHRSIVWPGHSGKVPASG